MKFHLSLLATAAAAVFATNCAHAQSSVTISGLLDAYVGSMRAAGSGDRVEQLGSGGLTTSWFGFRGVEDLGGGLSATFALTSFMRVNTGSPGRFDGDPFFSRDANVGLAGRFGSVRLGRGTAPNFLPTILTNPFGDSFTFSPLVLHANVNTPAWAYRTTPSDTGWSNQVVYSTPSFGGLTATLQYQFGARSSTTDFNNKKNIGLSLLYANGPWSAVAFYERDQVSNPVNPSPLTTTVDGVVLPETKKDWMVGGTYNAGFAKLFLTYGGAKAKVLDYDANTASIGASVPVGAGLILAAVARTKVEGAYDGTRTTGSLGYDYFLSKRTDLYAVYMHDRITDVSRGNSYGLGIRHRF
ncbi:porin [Pseudorhodoferax sp. Leaf267]|uniref:porin n=1 Tax=Pseudorhodoferax sp. Leaf267 TaxID=1736316 RepID=UPI000700B647|nr:porin [Pseudorhodoferax sp. Leaf267]KQP19245.1 porin [Pseudorhodoferax sp. Leaf267]